MREETCRRGARLKFDAMPGMENRSVTWDGNLYDLSGFTAVHGRCESLDRMYGIDGECNAPETGALRIILDGTNLAAKNRPVFNLLDHFTPSFLNPASAAREMPHGDACGWAA
jgi:hypothetical protein